MASGDESTQVKVIYKGEEDESTQVNSDKGEDEQSSLPIDLLPQPGYDHVFVDPVPSENYCGICLLVVRDPVQVSSCGHLFCVACLDVWLGLCEESEDRKLTCPSDNNVITRDIIFPDRNKERYILNQRVFCDNKPYGCTSTTDLRHYESHLKDCKSRAVPCPLLCGQDVAVWALKLHVEEECLKRLTMCRKCGEMVEEERLWEHPPVCPMEEVTCDYCSHVVVYRHQIIDHYGRCREFPVHCTFREFGCRVEIRRQEMSEHEAVFVQRHLALMMKSFTCLQNETSASTAQLKEELKNSKAEFKTELGKTNQELNVTRDEFNVTMEELNVTREELNATKGELNVTTKELKETIAELSKCLYKTKENLSKRCEENKKLVEELEKKQDEFVGKLEKMNAGLAEIEAENKSESENEIAELREDASRTLPFRWEVDLKGGIREVSPHFYTKNGYKLFMNVWYGGVYGFDCMLTKGENDKDLRWPMEGNISMSVTDATSGELLASTSHIYPSNRRRPVTDGDDNILLAVRIKPPHGNWGDQPVTVVLTEFLPHEKPWAWRDRHAHGFD